MTLHITADLTTGTVEFRRDADVPDELWLSLGRNVDPDRNRRYDSTVAYATVERFLGKRTWLIEQLRLYGCPADLDATTRNLAARAQQERGALSRALKDASPPVDEEELATALDEGRFTRELRPFQTRDLAKIAGIPHGANFSVPGAGKTTVALALYEYLHQLGQVDRLLVIAPLSAFGAWMEEAEDCFSPPLAISRLQAKTGSTEIVLVNYQLLASRFPELRAWMLAAPTHLILDEAHRMKRGQNGQWGAACLSLAYLAARRDILTGTPAPQHPRDFDALIDFLWPQQAIAVVPEAARAAQPTQDAMGELSERLQPLFVRTQKTELGLREPILRIETVAMGPLQAEIYQALRARARRAVITSPDQVQLARMGVTVAYLLEGASNPGLLARGLTGATPGDTSWPTVAAEPGSGLAEKILRYGEHEIPQKVIKLAEIVRRNAQEGRKTLVWSSFVDSLTSLHEQFLAPYQPALVYGGIPPGDADAEYVTRERELARFRADPDCMVLLANPAAMSEGVSLHHVCHDAVYVDRTFNAGQYLQSIDRIHRLGLDPGIETHITFLVATGTIDEVVERRIHDKAERLSQMLRDPGLVTMALPDEDEAGAMIDADDLDALFGHLRGDGD